MRHTQSNSAPPDDSAEPRPVPMRQPGAWLRPWMRLASLTVLSIYFFLFMEWLFMVTRPSFMGMLSFTAKLGVLLLPGLLISAACALPLLALFGASRLPGGTRVERLLLWAGAAIPAGFLAATGLMWLDNFTHTVLKFSIVDSKGIWRGVYAVFFLLLLGAMWRWAGRAVSDGGAAPGGDRRARAGWSSADRVQLTASLALLALSLPMGAILFSGAASTGADMSAGSPTRRLNILLIGTDGLNAADTSIYAGAPGTPTTPFLKGFARETLLAENNFPNATITTGSLVSMFASKLPTRTRMLYPPDILQGSDAFQHLPGLLKKAGYFNATIGVDYYADPQVLNLQDGFAMINGRSETMARLYRTARAYLPESAAYFLSAAGNRLRERLLHIFYIQQMPNPYAEVTAQLSTMSDEDRIGYAISLFRDVDQPLFIHTHLMSTHVTERDGYLDGVRHFDGLMKGLVSELKAMGELDNTLIVVYTDHGHRNVSNVRIPLMFRFPGGEHARKITGSTQNLDIAPTILDAIGMQPPAWMEGVSLLRGEPPAERLLFSVAPGYRVDKNDRLQLDLTKIKPPFYQFGTVTLVTCGNWYALDTTTLTMKMGAVGGSTAPCPAGSPPGEEQARAAILDRLASDHFDVSEVRGK